MEEIKIVMLNPNDWELYKDIRLKSLQNEPQAYLSSYARSSTELDEKWRERLELAQEGKRQWLSFVKAGEEIVGMAGAWITEEESETAEIISVYLAQKYRGQGIGKRLMEHLISTIKQNSDIKRLTLEVNSTQPSAVKLYESCGFRVTGKSNRILGDGKEYEELLMQLVLAEN